MTVRVSEADCIGCGSCVLLCPEEALEVSANFVVRVDPQACTDCLTCLDCCSLYALEVP